MSCPICEKDTAKRYHPFCSKRCADVDLGKWLSESYTIPVQPDDIDDESELLAAIDQKTRH